MDVRPGYKQTEVGVIPDDWDVRPCSEVSERIMVGIVIRPTQYYVPHGVPAFRSANIREDGITDSDLVYISTSANALLAKSQTRTGDILTVRTGYPGTSAVVRPGHASCNCIDILITRPAKHVWSEFLAIWINSPFGKEQVVRNQGGLAQQHFNVGDMRNLVVALPPLPEQRVIAAVLSDVGALLGGLDRLIAKKRDLKQAAVQQLLTGQTRLPGFHGEWEMQRLGEVADISKGAQLQSQGTDEKCDIPHYNGGMSPSSYTHRANAPADSIVISEGGNSCGYVQFIAQPFWCGGHCYLVKPKSVDKRYLYHALKARQQSIMELRVGSGLPNVQKSALQGFSFAMPGQLSEQTAIATVLSDMDAELAALKAHRNKTRVLKQGMIQELLTGRTRLVPVRGADA